MYDDNTWHMNQNEQIITLFIALLVCVVIGVMVWYLVRDVVADDTLDVIEDELDEFTEDMFLDRDQHEHPVLLGRWDTTEP